MFDAINIEPKTYSAFAFFPVQPSFNITALNFQLSLPALWPSILSMPVHEMNILPEKAKKSQKDNL